MHKGEQPAPISLHLTSSGAQDSQLRSRDAPRTQYGAFSESEKGQGGSGSSGPVGRRKTERSRAAIAEVGSGGWGLRRGGGEPGPRRRLAKDQGLLERNRHRRRGEGRREKDGGWRHRRGPARGRVGRVLFVSGSIAAKDRSISGLAFISAENSCTSDGGGGLWMLWIYLGVAVTHAMSIMSVMGKGVT